MRSNFVRYDSSSVGMATGVFVAVVCTMAAWVCLVLCFRSEGIFIDFESHIPEINAPTVADESSCVPTLYDMIPVRSA